MVAAFVVVVIVAVVIAVIQGVAQGKARDEMRMSLAGNSATQQFISSNASAGIGVNEVAKLVIFTLPGQGSRSVAFRDLLQSEVIEDGMTLTKTQRTGVVGRGILGGVLLGPLGALGGALTAGQKSTSVERVRKIDLRVLLATMSNPVYTINFLENHEGVTKDSAQYRDARAKADRWYATLQSCIRQADADEVIVAAGGAAAPVQPSAPVASVADELNKLADLHSRGILDDREFAEQKALVLGRSSASPAAAPPPPPGPAAPKQGWPFD